MKKPLIIAAAITSLMLINTAQASRDDDSHEVRKLVQEGKVLPLEQLLTTHRERLGGRVLDLEMEKEKGRVIYEIKTIDAEGVVRESKIDAQTGEWLEEEVKSSRKPAMAK